MFSALVTPLYVESFVGTENASWPAGEWTKTTYTGLTYTDEIRSNTGRMTPPTVGTLSAGTRRQLNVESWKDTSLGFVDITVTVDNPTSTSSRPGIWLSWDGSVTSPTGYFYGILAAGTSAVLYKVVAGVYTVLITAPTSLTTGGTVGLRIRRVSGFFAYDFDIKAWTNTGGTAEPLNTSWATIQDNTYLLGQVGLANWYDGNITQTNVTASNYVTFSNLSISSIPGPEAAVGGGIPGNVPILEGACPTDVANSGSYTSGTAGITGSIGVGTISNWVSGTAYTAGAKVVAPDGKTYIRLITGTDAYPPSNTTYWVNANDLVYVLARVQTGGGGAVGAVTGLGITWGNVVFQTYASSGRLVVLYTGTSTSGAALASGGSLTISNSVFGAITGIAWSVIAVQANILSSAIAPTSALNSGATSQTITPTQSLQPNSSRYYYQISAIGLGNAAITNLAASSPNFQIGTTQTITAPNMSMGVAVSYVSSSHFAQWTWTTSTTSGLACILLEPNVTYPPHDGQSTAIGAG